MIILCLKYAGHKNIYYFYGKDENGKLCAGTSADDAKKYVNKSSFKKHLNEFKSNKKITKIWFKEIAKTPKNKPRKKYKKNPISNKSTRAKKAKKLYTDFTGMPPDTSDIIDYNKFDTLVLIGPCLGIMYETVRDNETQQYMHEFNKNSRPQMCVTPDGKQIVLIGGDIKFKDTGINDTG